MGKNKKKQWDVVIIGAGAAGMMAAITAAREKKSVCLLERADKLGKKILATGNGKCNFTNSVMTIDAFHGERAFIAQVLEQFSVTDCLDFFRSIGIYPKCKNGYYYPNSEQAASVVTALEQELLRLGVKISLSTEIRLIVPDANGVEVVAENTSFYGKKLIIATGLLAAPKLGSNGSLLDAVKSLGHRFLPILPALCGFYCKGIPFKKTSGVRVQGTVAAYINGKKVDADTGEIQFTDYGLSGIPVFQISHAVSKGLYQKQDTRIVLTLLPEFDRPMLCSELNYRKNLFSHTTVEYLCNGLLPQKLADMFLEKVHLERGRSVASLSEKELQKLADAILYTQVEVTKYRDFEFAQVCTGGIPVCDVDWSTLESRLVKHIHFAGEILDVDGICGGYNLHFAWATGQIAAKALCSKNED